MRQWNSKPSEFGSGTELVPQQYRIRSPPTARLTGLESGAANLSERQIAVRTWLEAMRMAPVRRVTNGRTGTADNGNEPALLDLLELAPHAVTPGFPLEEVLAMT
jgi:hypothetical protein